MESYSVLATNTVVFEVETFGEPPHRPWFRYRYSQTFIVFLFYLFFFLDHGWEPLGCPALELSRPIEGQRDRERQNLYRFPRPSSRRTSSPGNSTQVFPLFLGPKSTSSVTFPDPRWTSDHTGSPSTTPTSSPTVRTTPEVPGVPPQTKKRTPVTPRCRLKSRLLPVLNTGHGHHSPLVPPDGPPPIPGVSP